MSKTLPDVPINTTDGVYRDHKGHSYSGIGLTKREYFAGLALQGLASNFELMKIYADRSGTVDENLTKDCVDLADALIKELNKGK